VRHAGDGTTIHPVPQDARSSGDGPEHRRRAAPGWRTGAPEARDCST